MNDRLREDAAVACAAALLDMACGALMDSEKRDFREEAYYICLGMLEAYDIQREGTIRLCMPSRN